MFVELNHRADNVDRGAAAVLDRFYAADFTESHYGAPASQDYRTHVDTADMLRQEGRLTEAIAEYSAAIARNPELAVAYNNRGAAYAVLGRVREALNDLRRALQLEPAYADALNNRGFTYLRLGKFPEAIADFGRAVELCPDHATAYNNRGFAYLEAELFGEAMADFDRAALLAPDDPVPAYYRAVACTLMNAAAEAS